MRRYAPASRQGSPRYRCHHLYETDEGLFWRTTPKGFRQPETLLYGVAPDDYHLAGDGADISPFGGDLVSDNMYLIYFEYPFLRQLGTRAHSDYRDWGRGWIHFIVAWLRFLALRPTDAVAAYPLRRMSPERFVACLHRNVFVRTL